MGIFPIQLVRLTYSTLESTTPTVHIGRRTRERVRERERECVRVRELTITAQLLREGVAKKTNLLKHNKETT